MRRAAERLDVNPGKPLVADGDLKIGGLGDDRAVSRPVPDERVGPDAGVLFVDNRRHNQPASRQPAFGRETGRIDHGGHAALHVLGSAAIEPARSHVGSERRVHPLDTDGIHVTAEHQRSPRCAAIEHADHVRAAWCNLLQVHLEPDATHVRGDRRRRFRLHPLRPEQAMD